MATSSSSASGSTATVAALVWTRPWLSVTGTRCTRWGPASCFRRAQASGPFTTRVISRKPPMSDGCVARSLVHAGQVGRPQVRFLAAFGAPDLEDDVPAVVGIGGDEQLAEPGVELGQPRLVLGDLGADVVAHVGLGLPGQQLPGIGEVGFGASVLPIRVDDRAELGVTSSGVARGALITGGVDLREARFELLELGLEVGEAFEHPARVPRPLRAQARAPTGAKWPPRMCSVSGTPSQRSPVAYKVRKSVVGTRLFVASSLVSVAGAPYRPPLTLGPMRKWLLRSHDRCRCRSRPGVARTRRWS